MKNRWAGGHTGGNVVGSDGAVIDGPGVPESVAVAVDGVPGNIYRHSKVVRKIDMIRGIPVIDAIRSGVGRQGRKVEQDVPGGALVYRYLHIIVILVQGALEGITPEGQVAANIYIVCNEPFVLVAVIPLYGGRKIAGMRPRSRSRRVVRPGGIRIHGRPAPLHRREQAAFEPFAEQVAPEAGRRTPGQLDIPGLVHGLQVDRGITNRSYRYIIKIPVQDIEGVMTLRPEPDAETLTADRADVDMVIGPGNIPGIRHFRSFVPGVVVENLHGQFLIAGVV